MPYERVAVIGGGLIGASLALALGTRRLAGRLVVVDPDPAARAALAERRAADAIVPAPDDAVFAADLVVIAAPVSAIAPAAASLLPRLGPGATLMDVGSVKAPIVAAVAPRVPPGVAFVPAHPLVGGERAGPAAAAADLFAGHVCVLTPPAPGDGDGPTFRRAADLWRALDMTVEIMTPAAHDSALARTSHAPHLVAFALMAALGRGGDGLARYAAGAMRDMTRVAAAPGPLWRDIFFANRAAVVEAAEEVLAEIRRLLDQVAAGDDRLLAELTRLAARRRALADRPGWAAR
jgi:cyclohexadieny/prephenate dehydrogenase